MAAMRMKPGRALAVCAALLLVRAAAAGQAQRRFEKADALTVTMITCMAQDQDGFFWVGSVGGLYKWDGKRTLALNSHNSGFPASTVGSILVDRDGIVWVAMNGMGIFSYDKKTDAYRNFRRDPKNDATISSDTMGQTIFLSDVLAEDPDGGIWIATTESGICRIDPSRERVDRYRNDPGDPGSLPSDQVYSLEASRSGDIWVGTNSGLSVLRKGQRSFKTFRHDPGDPRSLSHDTVTVIVEDSGGRIWAATTNGLNLYDPVRDDFTSIMAGPGGLGGNDIFAMAKDRNGFLWLGHMNSGGGLSVVDTRSLAVERYRKGGEGFGLPGDRVRHVAVDNDGAVWVLEESGNARFEPDYRPEVSTLSISKADNPVPPFVFAVLQGRKDERLLFGLGTGNVLSYDTQKGTLERHWLSNESWYFYCGLSDPDGTLWIADNLGFVNRIGPGAESIGKRFKATDSMQFVLIPDPKDPDIIWAGTQGDGIVKISRSRGTLAKYRNAPGDSSSLSSNNVLHAMAFDAENPELLYVGTMGGGLNLFDTASGKVLKVFRHDKGDPASLSNDFCGSMLVSSKGQVWITTSDGLNLLDRTSGTFTRYSAAAGNYPGDATSALLEDDSGCLWIGDARLKAVIRFDPTTGKSKIFGKPEGFGLGVASPFGSMKDPEGRLWITGELGATFFDPEKLRDNDYLPKVFIDGLSQAGVPLALETACEYAKEISLPWDKPFFEFEAASLSYRSPESNRYRYMLEGVDKDWYEAGFDNKGRYSGLRGGNYLLKVMGSNNDGIWSDKIAVLRVRVANPFWREWWFYAAIVLGMLALAHYVVTQRVHKIKAQAQARLLGQEMELAKRIQTAILPKDLNRHPELEIAASMIPADEVGGDYYDIQEGEPGTLWLAIGDVSGHGVKPGLIMMIAQTTLAAIAGEWRNREIDPVDLVAKVNRQVYASVHERLGAEQYMTFNLMKYFGGGRVVYAGAHLPILVHRASSGSGEEHDTEGTWLNLVPEIQGALVLGNFNLQIGDTMVVYTDGISEAFGPDGTMWGISRLQESIKRHIAAPIDEIPRAIMADVLSWSGGVRADDMTIMAVRRVR